MIRAFIAIELDQAVLQRIGEATAALRQRIPGVRWTPAGNCHLTLKFLGDIDEGQIEPIGQLLGRELNLFPRFTINAKGLGVFPDVQRARVLWIGVEGKPLAQMAEGVDSALVPLGFEPERRKFTAHLTIGRWRQFTRSDQDLRDVLVQWKNHDFGDSTVDEVVLFQSCLKPSGAEYRRLKAARLGDSAAIA